MDEVYIEKVLNGDTDAFRYFIQTYKEYAFSISFSILKDEYQAEEALQESFIKAFKSLKKFKKDSAFRTWFVRIVINESLRRAGKKVNEYFPLDGISEYAEGEVDDSLGILTKQEQKFYVSVVFEQLQPNESLALELYYLKGNSISEIKELTGWSSSKIKMLLLRGRKNFYGKLKNILKSEVKEII